jgi:hypothetical protein
MCHGCIEYKTTGRGCYTSCSGIAISLRTVQDEMGVYFCDCFVKVFTTTSRAIYQVPL